LDKEAVAITVLISFAWILGLLGIIYLAAYARVAKQGRDLHRLQQRLNVAQARHQALVEDVARLDGASRISTLASRMNMVPDGEADYVEPATHSPMSTAIVADSSTGTGRSIELALAN